MQTEYHSLWASAERLKAAGNVEEGPPLGFMVHEESRPGDVPHGVGGEGGVDAVNVVIGQTERVK